MDTSKPTAKPSPDSPTSNGHASSMPSLASPRCAGVTKKGAPCPWKPGEGSAFCWRHGDPATKKAILSARGKAGAKAGNARRKKAADQVDLSTPQGIRKALESLWRDVEGSGKDALQRAPILARLTAAAIALLEKASFQAELDELREILGQLQKERGVS